MCIHEYSPGVGADNPLGANLFINTIIQLIRSFGASCSPLNDFVTDIPIQTHRQPSLTCRKMGQGQHRIIIYINFVEPKSIMLHAKFQDHRICGSGAEVF